MPDSVEGVTGVRQFAIAPFDVWQYEDFFDALKARLPTNYEIRRKYVVDGDHLQGGEQWVGPGDGTTNDKIKKQFVSDDALGDALNNIGNAFREPHVTFTPIAAVPEGATVPVGVKNLIDEANSLVSDWWDANKLQELTQDRLRTAAWSGFAGLRPWIPSRFLVTNGQATGIRSAATLAQALSYIHLSAPEPQYGGIIVHEDTQDKCAVTITQIKEDKRIFYRAEVVYLEPARKDDESAKTILRVVYQNNEKVEFRIPLSLNGRLLFAEINTRALLTDSVIRTQQQLNFLCSVITRMAETAAFRERYITNSRAQGRRVLYDEVAMSALAENHYLERDDENRLWDVEPVERTLGANTTNELVGLPKKNLAGDDTGFETPSVIIADPVDPTPYIEAAEAVRRRLLRQCGQGHLAGASNFEVSGIAYEQSRSVFEKDLNARRLGVESMLRDVILNVITLAETITDKVGYFTSLLRIVVNQWVDAGPRSPDIVRLDHEAFEKGLLSRATAMSRMGVEDLTAEMVLIGKEAEYILGLLEKVATVGVVLDADSLIEMMKKLGLPETIISGLKAKPEPQPAPSGDANVDV